MAWNALSWSLYWAAVLPNVASGFAWLFGICAFVCFVAGVIAVVAASFTREEAGHSWNKDRQPELLARSKGYLTLPWKLGPLAVVFVALVVLTGLVPDRQTFYLIAASQAGEAVATSQDGKEMIDAVKTKIHEMLGVQAKVKSP